MNQIKRYLGLVWMALGPIAVYYLIKVGASEITEKPTIDTKIQWGVFILISLPIAIGLVIFGYYAWKGEYNQADQS